MISSFYLTNGGWALVYVVGVTTVAFATAALLVHLFAGRDERGKMSDVAEFARMFLLVVAFIMLFVMLSLYGLLALTQQSPA